MLTVMIVFAPYTTKASLLGDDVSSFVEVSSKPVLECALDLSKPFVKHHVAVVVIASVTRPCLWPTLDSLLRFYREDEIYIYHNDSYLCENFSNRAFNHLQIVERASTHRKPILTSSFNDTEERIRWRSSIVYDYAKVYELMSERSEILISTEDDVIHHFDLRNFPPPFSPKATKNICFHDLNNALLIDYKGAGSQTYILNSSTLPQLSHYLLALWDVKPVDYLVYDFYALKHQIQRESAFQRPSWCSMIQHNRQCNSTRVMLFPNETENKD